MQLSHPHRSSRPSRTFRASRPSRPSRVSRPSRLSRLSSRGAKPRVPPSRSCCRAARVAQAAVLPSCCAAELPEPPCLVRAAPLSLHCPCSTVSAASLLLSWQPPVFSLLRLLGRAIDFDVWVDDLQLFLQCDKADGLSLLDLTSGASPTPAADADATVRSQWATRDAAARLAVHLHLPTTERAHFSQYKSAQTLYDAVVARYSSSATAALSRLMLPYLFPNIAAFPTVADLITHLRTLDTRYRAALPADRSVQRLHEEIWLRRPPGFTGSFPPGTQWSLPRPVYGLRQAPREWHDTPRTTLAALGFAPSTADPSLFLRTNTSSTFSYLGELRSYLGLQITRARAQRTITLTQSHMVRHVLQHFGFTYSSPQATPLSTRHSLSALPSDEYVESSGSYPKLVGCLMYLMTCTRPDLAYPLSILARYVAPGRHRPEHIGAAKRVLRYVCSTSGMGLVLGGRRREVLTGHADASWADDQATQWSSQGYSFSLGSGSVSWRSTRSSSVLGSSCEAEIYAGAMAA
ncbi:unnamed protein product [Closterium sp. NIES-54]